MRCQLLAEVISADLDRMSAVLNDLKRQMDSKRPFGGGQLQWITGQSAITATVYVEHCLGKGNVDAGKRQPPRLGITAVTGRLSWRNQAGNVEAETDAIWRRTSDIAAQ